MSDGPNVKRVSAIRLVYILTILLCLSACAIHPAQVSDRPQPPSRKIQQHKVSADETLYSIAWRYGLDYRTLAEYNGISPPFTIYPGQVLLLKPGFQQASKPITPSQEPSNTTTRKPPRPSTDPDENTAVGSPRWTKNKASKPSVRSTENSVSGPPNWRWPAEGKVIDVFEANSGLNQGIDIRGNLGESVDAAADGHVVYAGSGLRGYGNLVIIKHNDIYLSAYAHNRSLKVAEGDRVKAGQTIAEMGKSSSDQVTLHFEIRRDGKPVNPMHYLPKR